MKKYVFRLDCDNVVEVPAKEVVHTRAAPRGEFGLDFDRYVVGENAGLLTPFDAGTAQVWEWYGREGPEEVGYGGRYKPKGGQQFVVYATSDEGWDGDKLISKLQSELNAKGRFFKYDFRNRSHYPLENKTGELPSLYPYDEPCRVTLVKDKFVVVGSNSPI